MKSIPLPVEIALEKLIQSIRADARILALMGLGSMADLSRLDQFSDMDFFLIVAKGKKQAFIDNLSWLDVLSPIYTFRNTIDGYKVLTNNQVFLEFAVFEIEELDRIPYHQPRILYSHDGFDVHQIPLKRQSKEKIDVSYALNEALTNLYIGLLRNERGELLSAFQMIQVYGFQRVMQV